MEQKSGQAPDLNNLQPHPDKARINLARAAEAAYALENPTTPGQIAAASGEGVPDLAAIRRHIEEPQKITEQSDLTESE